MASIVVLVGLEGKLLRMATTSRVRRDDFLEQYRGSELDPDWLKRCAKMPTKNWQRFAERYRDEVKEIRADVAEVSSAVGLPIMEFRRIVGIVQKGEREAAKAQKGNDRGEPAARDLDCQKIHQPRPAVPGPDPRRQHRPDEGRR